MVEKKIFANGQKVYDLHDDYLTYYFKDGSIKAEGPYMRNKKEGEWKHYRKNGHMWKIGHYKKGLKHGNWQRLSPEGQVEADETYVNGKRVK